MTLKTLASATLLLALASPAPVAAAISATYVFEAVDSYDVSGERHEVRVTGIILGEAEPRTVALTYKPIYSSSSSSDELSSKRTFERCERLALIAMSKPGQYLLEMRQESTLVTGYPMIGCKLTRR